MIQQNKTEKITICVGLKNRTYFLVSLLQSAKKCINSELLEFSIFDCCSDDVNDFEATLRKNWQGQLQLVQENVSFSRSYTFNKAVENAKTKFVFLCDADMILPENFVSQFFDNVSEEKTWFPICFSLLKDKPLISNESENGWWRNYGYGIVGISKKVFIDTGKLNEKFIEWGGEDNDFYDRVSSKKIRKKCSGLFHKWHCSQYNLRTTPQVFREKITSFDLTKPKYVIAITTFNRILYLKKCIESWLETYNYCAEWTLIIADDGSTDGTLEYIESLNVLCKKIIIKNKRTGIHHQVNQIIKYLENIDFDVCFKCDDDLTFLKSGWDDAYFSAIQKYGYEHLVFHDESWIGGKYKGYKHRILNKDLLSRVDVENTQGAFYTITPKVIKTVGYFDLDIFGLCGLGHIDYTARCCRGGHNVLETIFDIENSNSFLKLITENYSEAPNEFRYYENTPSLIEVKNRAITDSTRLYVKYNECNRRLMSTNKKIVYMLPSIDISGGVAVIVKHANMLREKGYHVFLLLTSENQKNKIEWIDNCVAIFSLKSVSKYFLQNIDILVMTFWDTVQYAKDIDATRKIYFVQSDERRFYSSKEEIENVHRTYIKEFEYMTEAKWIQQWLKKEFGFNSHYVPNGIDLSLFYNVQNLEKKTKIRVLLEGAISVPFKGVEDAYNAIKDLNCEIWIVSNSGKPKKGWRYNKFYQSIAMNKMKDIYSSCDILLKLSKVEGFFGPPMEAMACGCAVVVGKCTGYDEYIEHNENALVVDTSDIKQARVFVKKLIDDVELRNKLIKNGYETVKNWSWEKTILSLEQFINSKSIEDCESEKCVQVTYETKQVTQQKKYIENCEIIIVVHNALPYVQRCVESIKKYTDFPYKLTIVDNNSNHETRVFLKTLENVNLILNTKNYGFGYANNQAIRKSQSKYICFLNSDTIVTKNWLSSLIHCLEQNNAGIVGPVSNFVSSEIQQVNFDYVHPLEEKSDAPIEMFSEKTWNKFGDKVAETNRLIGFCMVTKKEILDKSGIFDERYEFNFEDDDLGLRVIEKGYKLCCALGVFVYHYGSKTFNESTKEKTYNPIFERSKKLYIEKWYNTGRIRLIQNKKQDFSIIYVLASNEPSGGVKVVFEHANRLKDRGYDVSIWCNKNQLDTWFDLHAPIFYFKEISEIPECDIAIGTYFTTLRVIQKIQAKVKIHFSQGYEALLYSENNYQDLVGTIKDSYRSVNIKFAVSKWLKSILDKEFGVNCHYIPNGINEYVFPLKSHSRNKNPRILIVSNYNLEFKGVKIALDAVRQYLKTSKGVIVRLASEKTKFDEGCEFHDMTKMSQEQIAEVYSSCDVTINAPFKVEGFSLPPLESMACGTPVITTDCGGNDYAQNGKNSLVINSSDSSSIQHALKLLFSNNILYSRLVEGGLKTANEYLWHNSIDVLEGVLHKLYANYWNMRKEQLSVCMIVKNEESCLANCLESIKSIASEIIIVDTGSTDNTIKIAKQFGAKIFHFEWIDDFSAARNFSLSQATQVWSLVLDADEIISKIDLEKLRILLKGEQKAYVFSTRNYVKTRDAEGVNINIGEYKDEEKNYVGWCRSDKVRLFPTNKNIKFSGQVHELVEQSINELELETELCDIPIHHYSKFNSSKNELYLKLGKEKALTTNDEKALYELGTQYMVLNNYDESIVIWRKLLEHNPKNVDALSHLGTVFNLLEDYKQAEQKFKESIAIKETEYAVKHLGICYAKQHKYEDAYSEFKKIAYKTTDFKTMTDFGYCCSTLKKYDEAIVIFEKCLKMNKEELISTGLLEIVYNEKGIELASKNNFLKAVRMFKSALSINPNFDAAKTNLSVINKLLETQNRVF